jgi:ATP synthase protein I
MSARACETTEQVGLTRPDRLHIIRRVAARKKSRQRTARDRQQARARQLGFDPEKHGRRYRLVGALAGIPALLLAGGIVGFFLGRWLDQRLDTAPWMQLVFFFLGMGASIRNIRQLLRQVEKDSEDL